MSYSMGSGWGTGAVAPAGPSPDSVAVVRQRISALAGELDDIRRQLGAVATPEWRSPAAAAFLAALTDLQTALSAAVGAFETAAGQVGSYGAYVRASSLSNGCFSAQGAGVGNGLVPGAGLSLGPDVGPAPLFGSPGAVWWG